MFAYGSDLNKVWETVPKRREQLRNWTGQRFPLGSQDSFVSAGLFPGLREGWGRCNTGDHTAAVDGRGYLAGRGMDTAEAESSLRVRVAFLPPALSL